MPQVLEVVQQHILDVVVWWVMLLCFVTTLTDFTAVKEFWKSLKIWRNYRHNRVARFFETQCRSSSKMLMYLALLLQLYLIALRVASWTSLLMGCLLLLILCFTIIIILPLCRVTR